MPRPSADFIRRDLGCHWLTSRRQFFPTCQRLASARPPVPRLFVIISARTEYACIAVLALAARYSSDQPVRIREIADPHGIPSRFLVQILLQLKGAGIVESTRGSAGGYKLARVPEEITLGQVMGVIDGQSSQIKSSTAASTAATRVLLDSWQKIASLEQEKLGEITFAQLAQKLRGQGDGMYYI